MQSATRKDLMHEIPSDRRPWHRNGLRQKLLCFAFLSLLPTTHTGATQQPVAQTVQDRLLSETPVEMPGGARFVAPNGWALRKVERGYILSAPEPGSHIAIFDHGQGDAEAAVAAAWAAYEPGVAAKSAGAERPPRDGWDRTLRFQYAASGDEPRSRLALALAKDGLWTVLIYDVSDEVSERRDAQIEVIFNSLLPKGYARESFAGKAAHRLDANRIAQLTSMIEAAREDYAIPGVALGLIQDGQIVYAGGFGVRTKGRTEPVDANTLFNVASLGKAFTTLMLAKQVEAGRYDWTTPVSSKWPSFRLGDPETSRWVQVQHLVCACTGMPRQDYQWLFDGENSSARSMMQLLARAQPTSNFGDSYQYSNLMAAAGGYFGGHVQYPGRELGAAYDAAMQKLVFGPLGMESTTANFSKALAANHASGHAPDIDGNIQIADQGLNYAAISTRPSGNHWSNINDLLRYVQMELAKGKLPDGKRYISEETLLARRKPQVTEGFNEYYGMGLKIDRQWGVDVIHHGGSTAGYRAHMMWLPDHGVGAVILINSDSGSVLRTAFRRRLLEILFDGKPIAEPDLRSYAKEIRQEAAEERKLYTFPADPGASAKLAKRYKSDELGNLTIRTLNGALWFDFGGWRSEMASRRNEDGSTSFYTISPGVAGYELVSETSGDQRSLLVREAQHQYRFTAVE